MRDPGRRKSRLQTNVADKLRLTRNKELRNTTLTGTTTYDLGHYLPPRNKESEQIDRYHKVTASSRTICNCGLTKNSPRLCTYFVIFERAWQHCCCRSSGVFSDLLCELDTGNHSRVHCRMTGAPASVALERSGNDYRNVDARGSGFELAGGCRAIRNLGRISSFGDLVGSKSFYTGQYLKDVVR